MPDIPSENEPPTFGWFSCWIFATCILMVAALGRGCAWAASETPSFSSNPAQQSPATTPAPQDHRLAVLKEAQQRLKNPVYRGQIEREVSEQQTAAKTAARRLAALELGYEPGENDLTAARLEGILIALDDKVSEGDLSGVARVIEICNTQLREAGKKESVLHTAEQLDEMMSTGEKVDFAQIAAVYVALRKKGFD